MSIAQQLHAEGLDWIVPTWDAPHDVHCFVTTRNAARSDGSVLDLGPAHLGSLDATTRASILANRQRVASVLPAAPVWLEQVHGRDVAIIDSATREQALAKPPIADAAVTRLPDAPLAVRVADCLPVFLADEKASVIAVAHAGWRGLSGGVLEATIDSMRVDASTLHAWLGPAIGASAFEVGEDVVHAFTHDDREALRHFAPTASGKWMADLPALARRRLAARGVTRVRGGDQCTWSDESRFFSWRRDRTPQRMAALIWRTATSA